jgi:hypothetical protein
MAYHKKLRKFTQSSGLAAKPVFPQFIQATYIKFGNPAQALKMATNT